MLAKLKIIWIFLVIFNLLTACHTLSSSEKTSASKKTRAASINIQLGMAYLDRHEILRAKQKFLTALHEAPQLPEVWYSLGYFFEKTGDQQRAAECYRKALELAPNRGDTNNNYGTYLCRTKHYQEAIKYFMKATRDSEYLDVASAYENAGLCSELIPQSQQAVKYFEEALKQEPGRLTALISLAELNYEMKDYEAANKNLNQYYLLTTSPSKESEALARKLNAKGFRS